MPTESDRHHDPIPARVAAARPVSDPAVDLVRMHREMSLLRMTRGLRWVGAHSSRGLIGASEPRRGSTLRP